MLGLAQTATEQAQGGTMKRFVVTLPVLDETLVTATHYRRAAESFLMQLAEELAPITEFRFVGILPGSDLKTTAATFWVRRGNGAIQSVGCSGLVWSIEGKKPRTAPPGWLVMEVYLSSPESERRLTPFYSTDFLNRGKLAKQKMQQILEHVHTVCGLPEETITLAD